MLLRILLGRPSLKWMSLVEALTCTLGKRNSGPKQRWPSGNRLGEQPGWMEKSVSNVLDAISTEHRPVIEQELENRNPALFDELRRTEKPTNEQSDAVIDVLSDALMKTFGPDWVPNDYGLKIERAIDAYLETWPIYR